MHSTVLGVLTEISNATCSFLKAGKCFVAGILAWKCGPVFAVLTGGTIVAYTAFTLAVTQWRTKFRQTMNTADSQVRFRHMTVCEALTVPSSVRGGI